MQGVAEPSAGGVPDQPPKVVFWFRIYAGALTALYVLCMIASVVFFFLATRMHGEERTAFLVNAVLFFVIGLPLAIGCALPFFLPRKPWVWVYDLVIICLGMGSCCILPASVALLIYWINPEAKAWFNRA